MNKPTVIKILEEAFDSGTYDRNQVRDALEDGAYLAQCGYTDEDQEAIEEAHALVSSTAEQLIAQAREALNSDCERFSDAEIIAGRAFSARISVGCFDGTHVCTELEVSTDYTDGKLEFSATKAEVDALCDLLIEDALTNFEQTLYNHAVN